MSISAIDIIKMNNQLKYKQFLIDSIKFKLNSYFYNGDAYNVLSDHITYNFSHPTQQGNIDHCTQYLNIWQSDELSTHINPITPIYSYIDDKLAFMSFNITNKYLNANQLLRELFADNKVYTDIMNIFTNHIDNEVILRETHNFLPYIEITHENQASWMLKISFNIGIVNTDKYTSLFDNDDPNKYRIGINKGYTSFMNEIAL